MSQPMINKTLYLWSNKIGVQGVQYLANVLKVNAVRQISDSSMTYIHCLRLTQTLTVLYLLSNEIGVQGAEYLGDALRTNQVRHLLRYD